MNRCDYCVNRRGCTRPEIKSASEIECEDFEMMEVREFTLNLEQEQEEKEIKQIKKEIKQIKKEKIKYYVAKKLINMIDEILEELEK